MTIYFQKIRWQNLLSTGNQWTEIDFQESRSTLVLGDNGSGKCVHPSTKIDVEMDDETYEKFIVNHGKKTTVKNIADFYKSNPECINKIKVNTCFGYKNIQAAGITAKKSDVLVIRTKESFIKVSPDHLMLSNGTKWIKAKDLHIGEVLFNKKGPTVILSICPMKNKMDLYDIQVEDVHEYYANGLVSHNSTMNDAIFFGLYGRPYRNINKPQLLNSITQKNLLVEIEFLIGKKQYLVRRGIRPNIFEIYVNDKLLNQSSDVREYQEILEKNILKMNYKSFGQVVILGSANYVPFMELSASDRRIVIEDLLDIQIFSIMNTLLKDRISENKNKTFENSHKKTLVEQRIDLQNNHMEKLKNNTESIINNKISNIELIQSEISEREKEFEKLNSIVEELNKKIEDYPKLTFKKTKAIDLEGKMEIRLRSLHKEIKFFGDNDECPTCRQVIDEEFKLESISSRETRREEIASALSELEIEVQKINSRLLEIEDINQRIKLTNEEASEHLSVIRMNMNSIQSLNKEIEDIKSDGDLVGITKREIDDCKKELKRISVERAKLLEEREILEVSNALLKDGGIKTKIIKQYVPVINKLVNKYLSSLEFFVNFELDERFNETIKSRFRDEFSYASFSEGEKFRINLGILLTWRSIAKLRNSASTNLLILDEVFDSSLDPQGVEEFLKILDIVSQESNIFVISHKGEALIDKFENTIKFEKHMNFSRIVNNKN